MTWELWDEDSGNLLGDFDDRAEAMNVAAELIAAMRGTSRFTLLTLDHSAQVVGSIAGVELVAESARHGRVARESRSSVA